MSDLPSLPKTEQEKAFYEDLSLLMRYSANRPPFTAWGFFDVDFKLLLSILSSITTYLIVVLQFTK